MTHDTTKARVEKAERNRPPPLRSRDILLGSRLILPSAVCRVVSVPPRETMNRFRPFLGFPGCILLSLACFLVVCVCLGLNLGCTAVLGLGLPGYSGKDWPEDVDEISKHP